MEEDEFIKKMRGVVPLNNKKKDSLLKKTPTNIENPLTKKPNLKKDISKNEKIIEKKSDFKITFTNINKELKRGKINIDRKIDLHGLSVLDAQEKLEKEVIKTYHNHKRCLLVITGKGAHITKNKVDELGEFKPKLFYGKIKNSIVSWLNSEHLKKYILTYQNAGIEQGGDGAIFVYLRKKRN